MSTGKFPRAYVRDVPAEGSDPMMIYVPFDNTPYGSPKSAMPKDLKRPGSLEHVGGTAGKKG
jgi:hypothetical protein